ncbi:PIN domain-containing protein [Pleomorphovibrio marinus]|uniref:hypothetical protein n=1 Tax=Pleomorphovibrio marinus TaxID=2164132 RepID=UPI0018E5800A|nr:hypothetical protein [Pleomorphovibrio marinus]
MESAYLIDTNVAIDFLDNKLPDEIIAATALTYDLTLLTRNIGDFKKIEGLKVTNPNEK